MAKVASALAGVLAGLIASAEPDTKPATASAPVERVVQWHETYKPADQEAKKRKCLLLVVYFDPAAPACEAFEQMTLSQPETRKFLAAFAACRLNVTDAEKKKRFAKTQAGETPLTQVFTPAGKLLDAIPGCIIPSSSFRGRLQKSLECRAAATTQPFGPAARWRAVRARLRLSTRAQAVKDIDKLLKLKEKKLPAGVTPARLRLAKGEALTATPKKAGRELQKALDMAPKDAEVGGKALLALARLDAHAKKPKDAVEKYSRYIRDFPDSPDLGLACHQKATLEYEALGDAAAAAKTLERFVREHRDDQAAVRAKRLLESLRKLAKPRKPAKPTKKKPPATKPAGKGRKIIIESIKDRGLL